MPVYISFFVTLASHIIVVWLHCYGDYYCVSSIVSVLSYIDSCFACLWTTKAPCIILISTFRRLISATVIDHQYNSPCVSRGQQQTKNIDWSLSNVNCIVGPALIFSMNILNAGDQIKLRSTTSAMARYSSMEIRNRRMLPITFWLKSQSTQVFWDFLGHSTGFMRIFFYSRYSFHHGKTPALQKLYNVC